MSRDPCPTVEELSSYDMKSVILIHIKHQAGVTTYISKDTTESLLRTVDVSLLERRSPSPYPSPLLIFFSLQLHIEILRTLLMHSPIIRMTRKKRRQGRRRKATPAMAPRSGRCTLLSRGRRKSSGWRIHFILSSHHLNSSTRTPTSLSPPLKVLFLYLFMPMTTTLLGH